MTEWGDQRVTFKREKCNNALIPVQDVTGTSTRDNFTKYTGHDFHSTFGRD